MRIAVAVGWTLQADFATAGGGARGIRTFRAGCRRLFDARLPRRCRRLTSAAHHDDAPTVGWSNTVFVINVRVESVTT